MAHKPYLMFDDYTKAVKFYRSRGIPVCQVAERDTSNDNSAKEINRVHQWR